MGRFLFHTLQTFKVAEEGTEHLWTDLLYGRLAQLTQEWF